MGMMQPNGMMIQPSPMMMQPGGMMPSGMVPGGMVMVPNSMMMQAGGQMPGNQMMMMVPGSQMFGMGVDAGTSAAGGQSVGTTDSTGGPAFSKAGAATPIGEL